VVVDQHTHLQISSPSVFMTQAWNRSTRAVRPDKIVEINRNGLGPSDPDQRRSAWSRLSGGHGRRAAGTRLR
jgi:hypothetical protein